MRRTIVLGGILLLAGLLAASWKMLSADPPVHDATPGDILIRYGYREIRPASTLNGPGTINAIDHVTSTYLMLHRACRMDMKEIENAWEDSPTIGESLGEELNGKFNLPAATLATMKVKVGYDKIQNVTISFSNTRIIQLDDETLFNIREKYFTGNCAEIIKEYYDRNVCVTQPFEVLRSDITYIIDYQNNVSAEDQAKITTKLQADLSLDAKQTDNDKISGQNIFVGIKMSEVCIVPNEANAKLLTVSDVEDEERRQSGIIYYVRNLFQEF
jgi:hypothetical protein